jgi:hypothetical protein
MLAASENNAISDDHPNEYLPRLVSELGAEANNVFSSNYLPEPTSLDYSTLEYSEFLDARAKLMLQDLNKLTSIPHAISRRYENNCYARALTVYFT